nr:MAG TPA: hypothetical protein [Caudoviricetes sp.]
MIWSISPFGCSPVIYNHTRRCTRNINPKQFVQ